MPGITDMDSALRALAALADRVDAATTRLEAAVTQRAAAPANAAPRASGGGLRVGNFGRRKGEAIEGMPIADLEWYLAAADKSLANPEKARFHDNERAIKAALEREIAKQSGQPAPANIPAEDLDSSEIPF